VSVKRTIKRQTTGFFWGTVNGDGNVFEGFRKCRERFQKDQERKRLKRQQKRQKPEA
jgi:hypothetical protein